MRHRVTEELRGIGLLVASIWGAFLVTLLIPATRDFGLVPRSPSGLLGIVSMPWLHASWGHLLGNTFPLIALLMLLAGSRADSWKVVVAIILGGGGLLWLFGRGHNHIGASGLVFGLIGYLIGSGIFERRVVPLLVAGLVAFLFGGTLLSGVLPTAGAGVSWEGHMFGAVAGVITAYGQVRRTPRQVKAPSQSGAA